MPVGYTMRERVCVVTGASSGLGKATALGLARHGATLALVCRDHQRGADARADIIAQSGNTQVDLFVADLASQAAIHRLAATIATSYPSVHVLINNAGVNRGRRSVTEDGIETTWAVNHLAPFLLTRLLLERLTASAPARVITITSDLRRPIAFGDLARERQYRPLDVYAQSKMANRLFTAALARRTHGTGVSANCLMPGLVRTNLGRDARGPFRLFLTLMAPFMKPPEQAARAIVWLASSPEVAGVTGMCFAGTTPSRLADDPACAAAEQLWRHSCEQTQSADI